MAGDGVLGVSDSGFEEFDTSVHALFGRLKAVADDVPMPTSDPTDGHDGHNGQALGIDRPTIRTDAELRDYLWDVWRVRFPEKKCCKAHTTPFEAFCISYFARERVHVIKASRGLGGKSHLFAALGLTEACTLGANVLIMGGSDLQAQRVLEAQEKFWKEPGAPRNLLSSDPAKSHTEFKAGNSIVAIPHSSKAARGPHPQRLRMDEIDEMTIEILDAAMGTTMSSAEIPGQTTLGSTHHYADGTFTEILKRIKIKGWRFSEWCYRETQQPHGWLPVAEVAAKRIELTDYMWKVEVEGEEPNVEGRAITPEAVMRMFDISYGEFEDRLGVDYILEQPDADGTYAHGADWGKMRDLTAIPTLRTDKAPKRFVAFYRANKRPYHMMAPKLNERLELYGGQATHDGHGVGEVVGEYLTHGIEAFKNWQGESRASLFNEYINAIEKGEVVAPRGDGWYRAHLYVTVDDLFGNGHPPDEFVACALAYRANKRKKIALV